jgi:predicted dehydrogenase
LASGYRVAAYEDYDDLLARCAAVVFAMSPAAQPSLAAAAVRRGKAILVEAPIAADLAGAQELAKLVERADVCRRRPCLGASQLPSAASSTSTSRSLRR